MPTLALYSSYDSKATQPDEWPKTQNARGNSGAAGHLRGGACSSLAVGRARGTLKATPLRRGARVKHSAVQNRAARRRRYCLGQRPQAHWQLRKQPQLRATSSADPSRRLRLSCAGPGSQPACQMNPERCCRASQSGGTQTGPARAEAPEHSGGFGGKGGRGRPAQLAPVRAAEGRWLQQVCQRRPDTRLAGLGVLHRKWRLGAAAELGA